MVNYMGSIGSRGFGPGEDVAVVALSGWFGRPRRRQTDLDLSGDGLARGTDMREARVVTLTLGLRTFDPDDLEDLLDDVEADLVRGTTLTLTIGDRIAYAQVDDHDFPTDPAWPGPERFIEAPVMVTCADPRKFSAVETTTSITGSNPTLPNAGTVASPLRFTVAGACVAPRVRALHLTGTPAWRFDDLTLTSGQTLTVDAQARTAVVTETGEDPVPVDHLAVDDDGNTPLWSWLEVPVGGGAYGFARTSGTSTASGYTRDGYL